MNENERKQLLEQRARRELDAAGYRLKKMKNGGYALLNAATGTTFAEFDNIEKLGKAMGLWGEDVPVEIELRGGRWIRPEEDTERIALDRHVSKASRDAHRR